MSAAPACAIPVLRNVGATEFCNEVQPKRKPVVLRGLDLGPCTSRWSDVAYVQGKVADQPVTIHVTKEKNMDFNAKNFKYTTMQLHDLLERASAMLPGKEPLIEPGEAYYLRAISREDRGKERVLFERDFPCLAEDLHIPRVCEPSQLFSSVLRVSSDGIRIVGEKKAVLWAPDEALNLYMDGDKSPIVDIDNPDLTKYPRFVNAVRHECDLQPGDILFIPAMWFHNMTAKGFGIAVNVFWKNLDPKLYDSKDIYGNKDLLPAAKAIRMMDNVFKQLDGLPDDLKDFYARHIIAKVEKKCLIKSIYP